MASIKLYIHTVYWRQAGRAVICRVSYQLLIIFFSRNIA